MDRHSVTPCIQLEINFFFSETLQAFDSTLVEYRSIVGRNYLGRKRQMRICMLIGNKDGICGYGIFKTAKQGMASLMLKKSVNKAGYRVCYFDRYVIK